MNRRKMYGYRLDAVRHRVYRAYRAYGASWALEASLALDPAITARDVVLAAVEEALPRCVPAETIGWLVRH